MEPNVQVAIWQPRKLKDLENFYKDERQNASQYVCKTGDKLPGISGCCAFQQGLANMKSCFARGLKFLFYSIYVFFFQCVDVFSLSIKMK